MFHKVKSIGIIDDHTLIAQFEDGICKTYDMNQLLEKFPAFGDLLSDKELFKRVHVEGSGFGIVWNDLFDLSCNEIWDNGTTVTTPFDDLIALSDATELWDLNESTLRKAISYGKLKIGFDVCNYGKQWVVTKKAMIREYGPLDWISGESDWDTDALVAEKAPSYNADSKQNG
ncbi:MAG: DUF2442 domain-containing protein [Spirochaetales bacterium]|nr:DUF2442 domain-containing protein [Spirochaetales bacterium]